MKTLPLVTENRRLLVNFDRQLASVEPALAKLLDALATGKAAWPLFLFGPAGAGKTCAALALCDVCETAGYWTVNELCDVTMRRDSEETEALWSRVSDKDLAVLDELGARDQVGALHYDMVMRFADLRWQRSGRVGIYISNVEPAAIQRLYDDRIASRLLAGTVFRLNDKDRRRSP